MSNPRSKEFQLIKSLIPQLKEEPVLQVQVYGDQIVVKVPDNCLVRIGIRIERIPNKLWNLLTPGEDFLCWD